MRDYFIKTERLAFSEWTGGDLPLALSLWGEENVTRYLSASGTFSEDDIRRRLETEIANLKNFRVQYWPVFLLETGELAGCCGLRPLSPEARQYEMGFHFRKKFWGRGYAFEAAAAAIEHAFSKLAIDRLFAGRHPDNAASGRLLDRLGFESIGDRYYEPTGLFHPSYELRREKVPVNGN